MDTTYIFFAGLALAAASASAQQAPLVKEAPLRAHLSFLADDLLEGRGTGQRGGDLAVRYLETQAAAIGLKPLANGLYRQPVRFQGTKLVDGSAIRFAAGASTFTPRVGQDVLIGTGSGRAEVLLDAPLVFVGYGAIAPEEGWNDYKDVDVKGKILVMMVNDPQPTAEEPNRFAGKGYTYYGRWMYKYEEAVRRGAAGALLIHTTPSAAYGWNVPSTSFALERFHAPGGGNLLEGWLTEDFTRTLFKAAGFDLDTLRAAAERKDFRPVELKIGAHAEIRSSVRQVEQFNVVGIVPGSDPKLRGQAVVYSAHWDHLGKVDGPADGTDRIYNGAIDNGSGAAALLAMAAAAVHKPAKRSQVFLWPAAEEVGMHGAQAYVANPAFPLKDTLADLNLDSMNFAGRTRDIGVAGAERSTLVDSAAKVAKQMGLKLAPPIPDLSGAYFRADHFQFAKAGVPAFNVGSAVFSGDGHFEFEHMHDVSAARIVAFKDDYHRVSDQYQASWDLSGMVQQAQFTLNLGYEVANGKAMPSWKKGDPFSFIKR
ncbi:M28 family peptidase [Pseudoduganella sp. DS3]|uniref:M28 family peptidase n=1 Tax=Pseudoduganella guangdongensis TaxID=2692179 RepID=A0A6N9HGL1_9BURK|nr:M28 family peptidase [Pseudoduganella guangdongensis]MYN02684.1 M28 family peptidase [Pseudoduganella guangdongensis]